jgi:hypothetical protein
MSLLRLLLLIKTADSSNYVLFGSQKLPMPFPMILVFRFSLLSKNMANVDYVLSASCTQQL